MENTLTRQTRRDFLSRSFNGIMMILAAALAGWDMLRYLVPPLRIAAKRKIYVSPESELPEGDVKMIADLRGRPVAVLRVPGATPIALSMVCTHLGCQVHWQPNEKNFLCPCHNGLFDMNGKVLAGPPPAPLPKYEVAVENENVYITFPEA